MLTSSCCQQAVQSVRSFSRQLAHGQSQLNKGTMIYSALSWMNCQSTSPQVYNLNPSMYQSKVGEAVSVSLKRRLSLGLTTFCNMMVISVEQGAAVANTPVMVIVLVSISNQQFSLKSLFVVTKHFVLVPSKRLIYSGQISLMLPAAGNAFTGVKVIVQLFLVSAWSESWNK